MNTDFEQTDVFVAGADGVHTYRIPGLLVAPGGTLLAFCEARKISSADASPTDMALKRSFDNGTSWQPLQRVLRGIDTEAIMNPCPVIDGDEVLLICMNAHKTGPGRHRQLLLTSHDDGQSWCAPRDITDQIENGDDKFVPGPGIGIRMRNGRLVVPGYTNTYDDQDGKRLDSRSRVLFSDDHGRSWRLGDPVSYRLSNESQVVELGDGTLMLNSRIQKSHPDHPGCRTLAISRDGGQTWEDSYLEPALNEMPCQAGFIRFDIPGEHGRGRLVFSNPDARLDMEDSSRTRMTVKISDDEGTSWSWKRRIHEGRSVYSCPALLPDGRLGLLYEWGRDVTTKKIDGIRCARFAVTDENP